jgi:hypothetical protein
LVHLSIELLITRLDKVWLPAPESLSWKGTTGGHVYLSHS